MSPVESTLSIYTHQTKTAHLDYIDVRICAHRCVCIHMHITIDSDAQAQTHSCSNEVIIPMLDSKHACNGLQVMVAMHNFCQ